MKGLQWRFRLSECMCEQLKAGRVHHMCHLQPASDYMAELIRSLPASVISILHVQVCHVPLWYHTAPGM